MIPVMKILDGLSDSRGIVHWLVATLFATMTTLALIGLHANSTAAGMVYLVLVVWSATQAGITLSLYIALLCALCFDFFFLLPYHTFLLAGAQQWVEMFAFVACSLVVSRVAELARRQTQQARQRQADVERLYELSQEMILHESAEGLIREFPLIIGRIFALDSVVLYVCELDQFYASASDLPMGIRASLRAMTQGPSSTLALPGDFTAMALVLGLRPVGALAWRPAQLSREVAAAVSAQVATMLARWLALETSARMEAARAGERLRTALIDSLTHELRTPLTAIRAAATTLLQSDEQDAAARMEMVKIVDEESQRLDRLIGDAFEMAQIDAHVVEVHPILQHPRVLLDQAVEASSTALARHHVTVSVDDTDDPAWFDPQLLGRVLRHLLENAARHTPPGSRVTLRSHRVADRLEFTVEDDGPGIDALDLPLIFEKFYRGKRSTASGKGAGMGLAIVRAILAEHGGGIEASSIPGQGTRFHFWVPLVIIGPESAKKAASPFNSVPDSSRN